MENIMETKKVSYYLYTMAYREMEKEIRKFDPDNVIRICQKDAMHGNSELQINWASVGAVDLDKALDFAENIKKACEIVKNFKYNGYKIDYSDEE